MTYLANLNNVGVSLILLYVIIYINTQNLTSSLLNINQGIPPHIYKFQISPGQQLKGILTCLSGSVDLDVYIYQQGRNLMALNGHTFRSISDLICRQNIYFTTTISSIYYLKVHPYLPTPHTQYFSYQLNLAGSTAQIYNMIVSDQIASNSRFFSTYFFIKNPGQQCVDYMIRYTSPPGIQTSIIFQHLANTKNQFIIPYDNSSSIYQQIVSGIDTVGDWSIKIIYNITKSYFTVTPYTLQLYKIISDLNQCLSSCTTQQRKWDNASLSCIINQQNNKENKQNNTNTDINVNVNVNPKQEKTNQGQIIGLSIGALIIIFILIVAICTYRKLHSQKIAQDLEPQNLSISQMQLNNKNYQLEDCTICLQNNCNSLLECGHLFHRKCILQWIKKNKTCPFCRKPTQRSKIKRIKKVQQQQNSILPLQNTQ